MAYRRWAVLGIVVVAACSGDRSRTVATADTTTRKGDSMDVAVTGEWPSELGTALLVPSDTETTAVVLYPTDPRVTADASSEFTLRAPNGETVRAGVTTIRDSARCGDAPIIRLSRPTPLTWTVGLSRATAAVVTPDSLAGLSPDDSSRLTVVSAKLASAVAAGTTSRLTGLRFAVTSLRRIRLGDTSIFVSQLVRRVNQEANPAEERTMIIAERAGAAAEFVSVHTERSEGTEETTAHYELIGALRSATALYLVVAVDAANGSTVEILERSGGAWKVRWTRGLSC